MARDDRGGRWNPPGVPLVYAAGSLSLAILEFFVHLDPADPPEIVAIGAEVPGKLKIGRVGRDALPSDWRSYPAPSALTNVGAAWVRRGSSAVLEVPSAIVPQELNYLLNPAHRDFARIRIASPEPFTLDPRLLK